MNKFYYWNFSAHFICRSFMNEIMTWGSKLYGRKVKGVKGKYILSKSELFEKKSVFSQKFIAKIFCHNIVIKLTKSHILLTYERFYPTWKLSYKNNSFLLPKLNDKTWQNNRHETWSTKAQKENNRKPFNNSIVHVIYQCSIESINFGETLNLAQQAFFPFSSFYLRPVISF